MNSSLLVSPCLAKESATPFVLLPLWIIERESHCFLAFLMKFSMKLRFHGPPWSRLHHWTALRESETIVMVWLLILSELREILVALNIANTYAEFISRSGMGEENRQMKLPKVFRRTPPTAAWSRWCLKDASTFHMRVSLRGGDHTCGVGWWIIRLGRPILFQLRQMGLRSTSFGE